MPMSDTLLILLAVSRAIAFVVCLFAVNDELKCDICSCQRQFNRENNIGGREGRAGCTNLYVVDTYHTNKLQDFINQSL